MAVSTGTGEADFERLTAILAAVPQLQYICVDVANGYSEHFVHYVKDVREKFPTHTIMVSATLYLSFSHKKLKLCGVLSAGYFWDSRTQIIVFLLLLLFMQF